MHCPLPEADPLVLAYARMRQVQGHQSWWPGESGFEICVGAILTQNTAWSNVERALGHLRKAGALEEPARLHQLDEEALTGLIRPAGCPRVKGRRLRAFVARLVEDYRGNLAGFFAGDTASVRRRLLDIHGIGPETADCMLLYAGGHPSFVVDAYTRRIFGRHGWCSAESDYGEIQGLCHARLHDAPAMTDGLIDYWQDYHAQLVAVGKSHCRPRNPRCDGCPLRDLLPPKVEHGTAEG